MNKIIRKLFISILTVILAVAALGTTTFAWFTLTNIASISNFEAQVRAEKGIEISLDGKNWVNSITSAEIIEQVTADGFKKFNHITSSDGITFYTLNDKNELIEATSSDHISLRIYFRAINIDKINLTELILKGTEALWKVDTKFTAKADTLVDPADEENNEILVNPADALRISIISLNADGSVKDLLEAYENGETATNTYISNWDKDDIDFPEYGAYSYYVAKKSKEPAGWADKELIETVALTNEDIEPLLVAEFDPELADEHQVASILINIWFEGYDPEAYNSLLNRFVEIGFIFTGDEE